MARTKQTARKSTGGKAPPAPPKLKGGKAPPAPPPPPKYMGGSAHIPQDTLPPSVLEALNDLGVARAPIVKPSNLDLMQAKANLKRAKANYKPIRSNRKKLFDNERFTDLMDWNKDYFPLNHALLNIQMDMLAGDLVELDFSGIDQLTDAFFYVIERSKSDLKSVKEISVTGCVHVTDAGVAAMCNIFGTLTNARLNGCRNVTEKSLYRILAANAQEAMVTTVQMQSTNVGIIPANNAEAMTSLKLTGCPLVSPTFQEYLTVGKLYFDEGYPGNFTIHTQKMVVLNMHMRSFSMCHFLKTREVKGTTETMCILQLTAETAGKNSYNVVEMASPDVVLDSLITEGCLVVIPYNVNKLTPPGVEEENAVQEGDDYVKQLSELVMHALNVNSSIRVALTSIKKHETSGWDRYVMSVGLEQKLKDIVKQYVQELRDQIEENIDRTWKVANMNFRMQKAWCRHEERVRGLEEFLARDGIKVYEYVDEPVVHKDFIDITDPQEKYDLGMFGQEHAKVAMLTPWQEKFGPAIRNLLEEQSQFLNKAPLVRCIDTVLEKSLHETQEDLTSRQRSTGLRILSQRGFCLFFGDVRRMPCVTNLEFFKEVLQLVQFPNEVTGKGQRTVCTGDNCSCWTRDTLKQELRKLVESFTKKLDKDAILDDASTAEQVHVLINILIKRHLLIEIPCDRRSTTDQPSVFFTYDDLPMFPPDLEEIFPCDRINGELQVDRFYTFTMGLPQTFLSALFRRIARVLPILRLWQYGVIVQNGGCEALIEYTQHPTTQVKTPVISVAVRTTDPSQMIQQHKEEKQRAEDALETAREAMWSLLNLCTTVIDYLITRMNVAAWVELACPECDKRQSTRSALADDDIHKMPLHKMQLGYDRRLKCYGMCLRIGKKTIHTKQLMIGPDYKRISPSHNMSVIQKCKDVPGALLGYTKCLLCNNCVEQGYKCSSNRLNGKTSRHCGCDTEFVLCPSCGICPQCTTFIAKMETTLEPGLSSAMPFKFTEQKRNNFLTGNIINCNSESILYASQPMSPEFFNYFDVTSLRGNDFSLMLIKGYSHENHKNPAAGCVASMSCSKGLFEVNENLEPNSEWILKQGNCVGFRLRYAKQGKVYKPPLLALDLVINGEVLHSSSSWAPQDGHATFYPLIHFHKPATAIINAPSLWATKKQTETERSVRGRLTRDELLEYENNGVFSLVRANGDTILPLTGNKPEIPYDTEKVHPLGFHKLKGKQLQIIFKRAKPESDKLLLCNLGDPILEDLLRRWKPLRWQNFEQMSSGGIVPHGVTAYEVQQRLALDCQGYLRGHTALYSKELQEIEKLKDLLFSQTDENELPAAAMALLPRDISTDLIFDGQYQSIRSSHNAAAREAQDLNSGYSPVARRPFAACAKSLHALCYTTGPAYDMHVMGQELIQTDWPTRAYWDAHLLNAPRVEKRIRGNTILDLMQAWHLFLSLKPKLPLPKEYTVLFPDLRSDIDEDELGTWLQHVLEHQVSLSLYRMPAGVTLATLLREELEYEKGTPKRIVLLQRVWDEAIQPEVDQLGLKLCPSIMGGESFMCATHGASFVRHDPQDPKEEVGERIVANDLSRQMNLYSKFVRSLVLVRQPITTLPEDFFSWFPKLRDLDLSECQLEQLPDSIGTCTDLYFLTLIGNDFTTLPDTLINTKKLSRVDISHNPIAEFPNVLAQMNSLEKIFATGTLIDKLPELDNWENLQVLVLNHSRIHHLPASVAKLQKLHTFHMDGVPWVKKTDLLSRQHFHEHYIQHFRLEDHFALASNGKTAAKGHEEVLIRSILDAFEGNQILSGDKIHLLNSQLFELFPRLGAHHKMGQKGIDFPKVLLKLENLERLSLSYQGFHNIPQSIGRLKNLKTLDLSHCLKLETLPASMGLLPLKELNIKNCPSLKTPPQEIQAQGNKAVMAYLRRLMIGSVTCQRTKLMFVGLGGAGKTSLAKAFVNKDNKAHLEAGEEITDGIDITTWVLKEKEKEVTFSVWDFAGQTVYYNTHQFFLSNRAVYLLLWNIRLGYEHAGLDFWLSSISVHAPKAPVFVIGTHCDQVKKWDLPMDEMKKRYPQIEGFHFVSSFTGQGVADMKTHLLEVASEQSYMGESIPQAWLNFEEYIIQERSKDAVMSLEAVKKLATNSGIFDNSEIMQSIQFLHELGSLQHFNNEFLKDQVVIEPQWIVDVMARVVSVKDSPIVKGKFYHRDMGKVWDGFPTELHQWLLRLTEEYDLTFPLPDKPINLVPCLLPEVQPQIDWPELKKGERESKMLYKFAYLPAGLFNRAQVRLYQYSDSSFIWRRGSVLRKNGHSVLIVQNKKSEVFVKAQGPRPENTLFLVHEVFEALISESFHGVQYDFQVPCPDCVNSGVPEPFMFSSSIVERATVRQAPFVQCTEQFHNVALADLHSIMPPDSSSDYDVHLATAVRGLADLKNHIRPDLFISFSTNDLPEKQNHKVVDPKAIYKELDRNGFKCFFAESASSANLEKQAIAIRDCKAFVALVSDAYITDNQCVQLFQYARQNLNKPLIMVVVGAGKEWMHSKIGILVADEVYVNMAQAERYEHKIPELLQMAEEKTQDSENKEAFPPCFISYSWSNSHQAIEKGSKKIDGALGYGDPRGIKEYLASKGINCWIDVERVGKKGLFEDIAEGLKHAKVMVACVSDQYALSANCAMELKFAVDIMQVPTVLAVVGTGNQWRQSMVGMLALKSNLPEINFQDRNEFAYERLLGYVQPHVPESFEPKSDSKDEKSEGKKDSRKKEEEEKTDIEDVSFQEMYELAQRKFLRQLANFSETLEIVYPRLVVVDFLNIIREAEEAAQQKQQEEETRDRPRSRLHRHDTNARQFVHTHIQQRGLGFKLLCEHEAGWHNYSPPIKAPNTFDEKSLIAFSPYLARITALLRNSQQLHLNMAAGSEGEQLISWLEELPEVERSDFGECYNRLRELVIEADTSNNMGDLVRCHLPSGKTMWLCPEHSKMSRVTVLTNDVIISNPVALLQNDDEEMLQYLERRKQGYVISSEDPVEEAYEEDWDIMEEHTEVVSREMDELLQLASQLNPYRPLKQDGSGYEGTTLSGDSEMELVPYGKLTRKLSKKKTLPLKIAPLEEEDDEDDDDDDTDDDFDDSEDDEEENDIIPQQKGSIGAKKYANFESLHQQQYQQQQFQQQQQYQQVEQPFQLANASEDDIDVLQDQVYETQDSFEGLTEIANSKNLTEVPDLFEELTEEVNKNEILTEETAFKLDPSQANSDEESVAEAENSNVDEGFSPLDFNQSDSTFSVGNRSNTNRIEPQPFGFGFSNQPGARHSNANQTEAPSFTFGSATQTEASNSNANPTGFNFGSTNSNRTETVGFSFGNSNQSRARRSNANRTEASSFTFGSATQTGASNRNANPTGFNFGSTNSNRTETVGFNFGNSNQSTGDLSANSNSGALFERSEQNATRNSGLFGQSTIESLSDQQGNNLVRDSKPIPFFRGSQEDSERSSLLFNQHSQGPGSEQQRTTLFGNSNSGGLFGNSQQGSERSTGLFGQTSGGSIFGNSNQPQRSLFGTSNSANESFGNGTRAPALFSSSHPRASGFGQTSQGSSGEQRTSLFGNSNSGGLFGNSQQSSERSRGLFGQTSQPHMFGNSNQQRASLFGNSNSNDVPFGSSNTAPNLFSFSNPPRVSGVFGNDPDRNSPPFALRNWGDQQLPTQRTYLNFEDDTKDEKPDRRVKSKSAHTGIVRMREKTKLNFEQDKTRAQLKVQAQAVVQASGAQNPESELCSIM